MTVYSKKIMCSGILKGYRTAVAGRTGGFDRTGVVLTVQDRTGAVLTVQDGSGGVLTGKDRGNKQ